MKWGFIEATTGFEPVIRVLQTHALPLGYVAIYSKSSLSWTRTNDTAVNSRVLYRLSYEGIVELRGLEPGTDRL